MIRNERWLHGPLLLLWKSEESWLKRSTVPELSDEHPEVKPGMQAFKTMHQSVLNSFIVRYSSWDRLKKAVAWLLRYKRFLLSKLRTRKTGTQEEIVKEELSVEEMVSSEREIITNVQQEAFRDHHVTDLIVRKCHEELAHAGREHVLASIRERFWIVKKRVTVHRVLTDCFKCRERSAPSGEQIMADLPQESLTLDRPPFPFVGIDYFGPFIVNQKRSHVKRYGCLFTCLALTAVLWIRIH